MEDPSAVLPPLGPGEVGHQDQQSQEGAGQVLLYKGGVYWDLPVRAVPLLSLWKTTQELVSFPHMCVLPYIVRGMRAHNPNQPCGEFLSYDVTPPQAADDPE